MHRALLIFAALLASCGGSTSSSGDPRATSTERVVTASDRGSTEGSPESEPTPTETGPAPTLGLRGTPDADGSIAITIENRGTELARIAPQLVLERAGSGGAFRAVEGGSPTLRTDCEHDAPACVELAPGAALHPPALRGDAQCESAPSGAIAAGTYRLVARSCGGAHRVEGDRFEIVAR
jgi:hypothetical protein